MASNVDCKQNQATCSKNVTLSTNSQTQLYKALDIF